LPATTRSEATHVTTAKTDAGSGINWLVEGFRIVFSVPAVFLVMGLILALISFVPLLGGLVMAICGPALSGGIIHAAREHAQGRKPEIGQLFRAFQEPGKAGPMLLLCLPGFVGGFALLLLAFIFGAGALLGGGLAAIGHDGSGAHVLGALGGGLLVFALIALLIALAVYALQFFAIPRVMLDNVEPFAAMKESLSTCLANVGAFLVYVIVLGVACVVAFTVFALIPLLGWIAVAALLMALTPCAQFVAWRQVFGDAAASAAGTPPAPPASVQG
jgi:hypothetical protein